MDDKKYQEFQKLVQPLMSWLASNCNPHTSVYIDCEHAELNTAELCVVSELNDFTDINPAETLIP